MFFYLKSKRTLHLGFAFCLCFVFNTQAKIETLQKISESKEWKALLYYENGKFLIKDKHFYLSKRPTPLNELKSFVLDLEKKGSQSACRFPARYFYLSSFLDLPSERLQACEDLEDFKRRAPLSRAYVVFASENISLPTSMMGHIYLKLSGDNHLGNTVDHAISFFTDVDDYNIPKLIFETLVIGKKGYYALTPHAPLIDKYLEEEGRNVWEYQLKLDPYKKQLLHNHLYELKDINLTYFFHTFNCATLIDKMLKVINPQQPRKHSWVTPLDVVRDIKKDEVVASTQVHLSDKWKIKALLENDYWDSKAIKLIKEGNIQEFATTNTTKGFMAAQITKSYFSLIGKEEELGDVERYIDEKYPNMNLDLQRYKNPNQTKSTSQVMTQYENIKKESLFKMTWLPASHFLEDDSSNYMNESELQVSRITLAYNEKKNNFFLDEFNVYSASSFQTHDPLTSGLSGKVRIGYLNYLNSRLENRRSLIAEGSLGKTLRIHRDIDIYSLAGVNYLEANRAMFAPDIEAGLILRAIGDMKLITSLEYRFDDINKGESMQIYHLKHFIDLKSFGILLEYDHFRNQRDKHTQRFSLGLKTYF